MIAVPAGPNTNLVAAYVAEKAGAEFSEGMYQAFAILNDNGEFCGGVVVSDFKGHDCQVCLAGETAMAWKPTVCRAIFQYIYEQLGCVRCTALVRKSNRKIRSFMEHMGFQLEGNIRCGFDGIKDALVYGLLASECKYLPSYKPPDGDDATARSEALMETADG